MVSEMCDECAKELTESPYIRVQVWGDGTFGRFERIFCSPECMKKYTEHWSKEIFNER